jgi:hypothetical protein
MILKMENGYICTAHQSMNMCGQKFSSEIGHKLYRKNPTRKEAPFFDEKR